MRTFAILFLLGFFVSCAASQDNTPPKEEVFPYTDYPGTYK